MNLILSSMPSTNGEENKKVLLPPVPTISAVPEAPVVPITESKSEVVESARDELSKVAEKATPRVISSHKEVEALINKSNDELFIELGESGMGEGLDQFSKKYPAFIPRYSEVPRIRLAPFFLEGHKTPYDFVVKLYFANGTSVVLDSYNMEIGIDTCLMPRNLAYWAERMELILG